MSIETDYATLRNVLVGFRPQGWAVEFGVYSGYSLGIISEFMPVIGFDSFKGLPEDWREGFPMGTFAVEDNDDSMIEMLRSVYLGNRRMIVPGLFEDTLPDFPFPDLALVHIDCDLYSSTVTALDSIKHRVYPGTIVVFDEFHSYPGWEQHEAKAWSEWCDAQGVTAECIARGEGEHAQEAAFVIHDIAEFGVVG